MSPKPIMRSLIDFFLKEIIIFPHYLLWRHSRSIAAYRYESHLIMSSFHTPHLHIHHRMRKLACDTHATKHDIGLLMHEFPDRMLSSTATRLTPCKTSSTVLGAGRRMAQSMPRVSWKPVSLVSTSNSAVYTGISPQRAITSLAWPSMCLRSIRKDTGS